MQTNKITIDFHDANLLNILLVHYVNSTSLTGETFKWIEFTSFYMIK